MRKRAVAPAARPTPSEAASSLAAALGASAEKQLAQLKDRRILEIDPIYGIPLEGNIPLQYLFGLNIIPLERAISLVGEEGALKSSVGWYLCNVMLKYAIGSLGFFIDVENKTNWNQVRGQIRNDGLIQARLFRQNVLHVEECVEFCTYYGNEYARLCPDKSVPVFYFIDSVGALASKDSVDAMEEVGSPLGGPKMDQARKAGALTQFLRAFVPNCMQGKPAVLIYVNHLKYKIETAGKGGYGPPDKTCPGGTHKDYLNTFTLELSKEKSIPQSKAEARAKVWISTLKSAFSKTGRKITVVMKTVGPVNQRYPDGDILSPGETEADVQRLYIDFDWDEALIELLTRDSKHQDWEKSAMDEVLDLSIDEGKVTSKRLGLKGATRKEAGALIHATPELVKGIQDVIGIMRKRPFNPYGTAGAEVPAEPAAGEEGSED